MGQAAIQHCQILQRIAAGRLGIDQDDVGTDLLHLAVQIKCVRQDGGDHVPGTGQGLADFERAFLNFVDDENLEHGRHMSERKQWHPSKHRANPKMTKALCLEGLLC